MRRLSAVLVVGLCLTMAYACKAPRPPVGRWEGTYESGGTIIAARLEIDKSGAIYISAPDAVDVVADSEADREVIRQRLALGLGRAWGEVAPRRLDFDGTTFRKPGGVAPQMEWDPETKRMTLIVYPGTRPSVRVAMRAVDSFDEDPWPR